MDIENFYKVLGYKKAVKIIAYVNYNECSFTGILQNCCVNSGQLARLLEELVKINILIKRKEPNNTFYKLDTLGEIVLKHMMEIKMYDNGYIAASPKKQ